MIVLGDKWRLRVTLQVIAVLVDVVVVVFVVVVVSCSSFQLSLLTIVSVVPILSGTLLLIPTIHPVEHVYPPPRPPKQFLPGRRNPGMCSILALQGCEGLRSKYYGQA